MGLNEFSVASINTKDTRRMLGAIDEKDLKKFMENFDNRNAVTVSSIESIFSFVGSTAKSGVEGFANVLYNDDTNQDIIQFLNAIEKQSGSAGTKKSGLFYKLIYATTADLLSKGGIKSFMSDERSLTDLAKKAKMFLLAKNDASEKISDTELSTAEQDTHRGNNMDVIQKLKTKRLSNVLKVFIVLVLYVYSQKRLNDIKGTRGSSSGGSRKAEEGSSSPKIEGESESKLDNIQGQLMRLSRGPGRVVQNGFSKKFGKKGERGWKIHVSPKANYVIDAVEVLFEIEKKYKCVDKFIISIDQYKNLNGSQAGKFITIYPISDDIAAKIAKDFHSELTKKV